MLAVNNWTLPPSYERSGYMSEAMEAPTPKLLCQVLDDLAEIADGDNYPDVADMLARSIDRLVVVLDRTLRPSD